LLPQATAAAAAAAARASPQDSPSREPSPSSGANARRKWSVLVTLRVPGEVEAFFRRLCVSLESHQIQCSVGFWGQDGPMPRERLLGVLRADDYSAILCTLNDRIDKQVLECAPSLQVVSTVGVSVDHIDLLACREANVTLTHTPGVAAETCAELAVALLLATARRVPEANRAVLAGEWTEWRPLWMCGVDVFGATVGVVGSGRVGIGVMRRLAGFGCRIVYSNRSGPLQEEGRGWQRLAFDELLAVADFVVVTAGFDPSSECLFNRETIALMKPGAVFVNVSHGRLVDQDALLDALRSGHIRAAGLDAIEPEPIEPTHALCQLPNCIVLPHIGSATEKTRLRMVGMAIENVLAALFLLNLAGEPRPPWLPAPELYPLPDSPPLEAGASEEQEPSLEASPSHV
jgi:lactate dehydrogenase-like 2-hydroxyacid dehydrogenase